MEHIDLRLLDRLRAYPEVGPWEIKDVSIRGTRNESVARKKFQEFGECLILVALGGGFLVRPPMWLMILHKLQSYGPWGIDHVI